jgi:hypothetical protein
MFYSETQSLLNFLRILNRLEVCVFSRAVKLESPCTVTTILKTKIRFLVSNLTTFAKCVSCKILAHSVAQYSETLSAQTLYYYYFGFSF